MSLPFLDLFQAFSCLRVFVPALHFAWISVFLCFPLWFWHFSSFRYQFKFQTTEWPSLITPSKIASNFLSLLHLSFVALIVSLLDIILLFIIVLSVFIHIEYQLHESKDFAFFTHWLFPHAYYYFSSSTGTFHC